MVTSLKKEKDHDAIHYWEAGMWLSGRDLPHIPSTMAKRRMGDQGRLLEEKIFILHSLIHSFIIRHLK
jgi:hypothetical protein